MYQTRKPHILSFRIETLIQLTFMPKEAIHVSYFEFLAHKLGLPSSAQEKHKHIHQEKSSLGEN